MNFVDVEYNGKTYTVPETGRDEDGAIFETVPDNDHAMAFLLQDGGHLACFSRYGSTTADCAPIAVAIMNIMADASGDAPIYYGLNSDMGLVVNESDDIVSLIMEHGTDADRELLDDESRESYVSDWHEF